MIFNALTGIVLVVAAGVFVWYDVCLSKARSQRMDLLNKVNAKITANVGQNPAWKTLLADYNYVSLSQHVRALVFFRNPYKLYPNTIQQLL